MPFTQEDLDLRIALALTRIDKEHMKAYGSGNWAAQEAAVRAMAKQIGYEIRRYYELIPAEEVERSDDVTR